MRTPTDPISAIERRIRQKAAYDHSVLIKRQMSDMTDACYYGDNTVPRLTIHLRVQQDDGTMKAIDRAPTIKEVGDLLAQAITDWSKDKVEAQAVNAFINKHCSD